MQWHTLLARAAVVVEVIVTLKLDDPREDDLLRAVDVSQQLGVVRVECRLHLGGEGVQVEVTVLRQLGIDAGVEAEVVLVGVGRLSRLLQVKPFDDRLLSFNCRFCQELG